MELEHAKLIVESLNEIGDAEYEVYENYSGRGMYGETTTAIVVPSVLKFATDVLRVSNSFVDEDGDCLLCELQNLKSDNLGRDYIIY